MYKVKWKQRGLTVAGGPPEVTLHPSNTCFSGVCPRIGSRPALCSPGVNQTRSILCSEKAYIRAQKKKKR